MRIVFCSMGFIILLLGCVSSPKRTPLPEKEVNELTSCKISLNNARKNLLKAGYEVLNLTTDSFNTNYKMAPEERIKSILGNTLVDFRKKFIVIEENGYISFKVVYQIIKYGSDVGSTTAGQSRDGNLGQVLSKQDADAEYYVENKKTHENTKAIICKK